jgi:hypothetical protein
MLVLDVYLVVVEVTVLYPYHPTVDRGIGKTRTA